jgi:hypothetical protein
MAGVEDGHCSTALKRIRPARRYYCTPRVVGWGPDRGEHRLGRLPGGHDGCRDFKGSGQRRPHQGLRGDGVDAGPEDALDVLPEMKERLAQ